MVDASVWENIRDITAVATPLLLAIVTFMSERSRRESKRNIELRDELDKQNEKKRQERDNKIDENFELITATLNDLCEKHKVIHDIQEQQQDEINKITQLNELNMKRLRASEAVIIALAEGMRDQHLDGNITSAVAKYRSIEAESLDSFYHNV